MATIGLVDIYTGSSLVAPAEFRNTAVTLLTQDHDLCKVPLLHLPSSEGP